jgi:hypothetical protein
LQDELVIAHIQWHQQYNELQEKYKKLQDFVEQEIDVIAKSLITQIIGV